MSHSAHGSSHALEIVGLAKKYAGRKGSTEAIQRIDLAVDQHEFVAVVGPSGCGKTTLLKCISGLMRPSGGEVLLAGRSVTEPPRELAIVFQDYSRSLFPWLTVSKNVMLPLRRQRDKKQRAETVAQAIDAVGLGGFEDHYPWQLSGGMQQRVAIARALAYRPTVLLLDEPFASVDAQTRADLEDLVLRLQRERGMTILLVTHDIDEAVYMSHRIVVLSGRPSSVVDVLNVDLPSQRDQIHTKLMPEFGELRARVYKEIKGHNNVATDAQTAAARVTDDALVATLGGRQASLTANYRSGGGRA